MLQDNLKAARKQKGLTQDQLANLLGVKRAVISKYESGIIEPSVTQLKRIAAALDVDVYSLMDFDTATKTLEDSMNSKSDRKVSLDNAFNQLNEKGQLVAVERIEELTRIPDYQKAKEPPQPE